MLGECHDHRREAVPLRGHEQGQWARGDGTPAHVAPDARVASEELATGVRGGPPHDCAGDGVWFGALGADAPPPVSVPNPTLAPRSVGATRWRKTQ